jgi:uncharacterized protein (DUF433 family)
MVTADVVRADSVQNGRWTLAGTSIPIADIRLNYRSWNQDEDPVYVYLNLTREQIQSALNFTFPALYETSITMLYSSSTFRCVCGEETSATLTGFDETLFECACGREWTMSLIVREVHPTLAR